MSAITEKTRVWARPRSLRRRGIGSARRNLKIAIAILGAVVVFSLIAPLWLPDPGAQDLDNALHPPSPHHLFGTDDLGRDILSRTLASTWLDLGMASFTTACSIIIGGVIGLLAGFRGGWTERILMRLVDFIVGFPYIVFVLVVVAILGTGVTSVLAALLIFNWALYARLVRAEMLVIRESAFIEAAKSMGFSGFRILFRHATPNVLRPVLVYALGDIMAVVLLIASLSFLGLGVPPPTPEWGSIIADGQAYLDTAWWMSLCPGVVVIVVGYSLVLAGDSLGELLGVSREAV